MVSYNDITKLTYYHENKQYNNILDHICELCGSNNILNILEFIRQERFVEKGSNIKLNYNDKEIIIFKENFLLDIPEAASNTIIQDEFIFTLGYPNIINHKCSPMYCIKKITYNKEEHILKTQDDYNLIPVKLYNKLKAEVNKYIENLNKIIVYKVGDIESRFFLHADLIINIIYLAFVSSYKNIIQEQLFLMKEYNFTYESFSKLSFHELNHYLKAGVKIINERNNSETTRDQ
jgi:hypothetical protein